MFTNHQQLKSETNSSDAEQPTQDHSQKWMYIGVLALIMVVAAVFIWIAVRRKKERQIQNKTEAILASVFLFLVSKFHLWNLSFYFFLSANKPLYNVREREYDLF